MNMLQVFTECSLFRKANVMDNMIAMMEKYSNQLEEIVAERTTQLEEERKKTEELLLKMLPRSVAEDLKIGKTVDPESFDCVTMYFSDIPVFSDYAANSTPHQVWCYIVSHSITLIK